MTPLKPKKILIIEDNSDILLSIKTFLELEGYRTQIAENGFNAMEMLSANEMPDLILLDMKMPKMNGWQFAIEFLNKHNHNSPIVVMTAAADAEQRAKDICAIGWIGKPFELKDLLAIIKKFER